eukprot:4730274-Amphidinium_carterae.2
MQQDRIYESQLRAWTPQSMQSAGNGDHLSSFLSCYELSLASDAYIPEPGEPLARWHCGPALLTSALASVAYIHTK